MENLATLVRVRKSIGAQDLVSLGWQGYTTRRANRPESDLLTLNTRVKYLTKAFYSTKSLLCVYEC